MSSGGSDLRPPENAPIADCARYDLYGMRAAYDE